MSREGRISIIAGVIVGIALLLIPANQPIWRILALIAFGSCLVALTRELEWIRRDDVTPSITSDTLPTQSISGPRLSIALVIAVLATIIFGVLTWPEPMPATESATPTQPTNTAPAPAPSPKPNPPKPKPDPRLAVLKEANDLAEKIDNIGDDYNMQLEREIDKQSHLPPEIAPHEKPFSDMRMDQIRNYERKRYADDYEKRAIAVRLQMLEEIPDIPPDSLNTAEAHWTYENPFNGLGFKEVAKNLRDLAAAYKAKIMPSA